MATKVYEEVCKNCFLKIAKQRLYLGLCYNIKHKKRKNKEDNIVQPLDILYSDERKKCNKHSLTLE